MKVWEKLTTAEIHKTLIAELAKSKNELKCARADVEKATSRIDFLITAVNYLQTQEK